MNMMTQCLFWISSSLMIPVIILLLAAFLYSLALLGDFFSSYLRLLKGHKSLEEIMQQIDRNGEIKLAELPECPFSKKLEKMIGLRWHPIHCSKFIADCHGTYSRELERLKFLQKVGPMLGLMGTLIPMGPALAGLASGDISSMSVNMQMAFATTVVGVFAGAVGLIAFSVKKIWYGDEIANLQYLLDLHTHDNGEATS